MKDVLFVTFAESIDAILATAPLDFRRHRVAWFLLLTLLTASLVSLGPPPASAASGVSPPEIGWHLAGQMTVRRDIHSATLLSDGSVLVAGGDGGYDTAMRPIVEASAELYDATTDGWRPASPMSFPRLDHTATLLGDGTVLVAGGLGFHDGAFASEASTERYDPATGRWRSGPPMTVTRWDHTATALPDGTALVTGGFDLLHGQTASAEVYDPATDAWRQIAAMGVARSDHIAVLLPDGRILVAGGFSGYDAGMHPIVEVSAEVYDPATGGWSTAGSMSTARADAAATLLGDGTVLVVGGEPSGGPVTAERFDPVTETWRTVTAPGAHGMYQTATTLTDGTVLALGHSGPYPATGTMLARRYDPVADTWHAVDTPSEARKDNTATLLADGTVLVTGGIGAGGTVLRSAERYRARHKD